MKFGIVLPTHIYNSQRGLWAVEAFRTLANTSRPSALPLLFVIEHKDTREHTIVDYPPGPKFETEVVVQPDSTGGTEQTLAWGTEQVLLKPEVTHVVWMGDDALFNSKWLTQLEGLVNRHPNAKSWSVYRSAHVRYHVPLVTEGPDVMCRSLCGHGLTFTREEWVEWGIHWSQGQRWPVPSGGNTLDLHHAYHRQGERWCTAQSYVQHTGTAGVNVTPGIPEYAVEFVGE